MMNSECIDINFVGWTDEGNTLPVPFRGLKFCYMLLLPNIAEGSLTPPLAIANSAIFGQIQSEQ